LFFIPFSFPSVDLPFLLNVVSTMDNNFLNMKPDSEYLTLIDQIYK
jgi:hypothetical protein